jgi:hypothetical protein
MKPASEGDRVAQKGSAAQPDVPAWRIVGDWFDLCNCAIGCPCVFGSNPTLGYCEGVLSWAIRDGHFGKLALGGFGVVLVMHWKGNVFDRNREFGFLIDDRADAAQRDALERIFTGKAGGAFAAWADLTLRLDGVAFVPLEVHHEAERWRVSVPGLVEGEGGPYRKYMVPEGETCRIYNAPRPEVVPGFITLGEARKNHVTDPFGRSRDLAGRSAKHIAFDLRGPQAFSWRKPLGEP